jgi:carboxymethylenebutenolidase
MATITSQEITIGNDGVKAYVAMPIDQGSYPTIVVLQEIFGVNGHIQDVTDRIATLGYIAIAPHLYHRQQQDFAVGYGEEEVTLGRKYKVATQAQELLQDIGDAIAYTQTLPKAKPKAIGAIGFCFGGHVAYLAACKLPEIQATASFYGAGIVNLCPGKNFPTVDLTSQITGKIYCFFGQEDNLIPLEEVEQIKRSLKDHAIDHEVMIYPNVGHGFFCDRRGSYDQSAAEQAWIKTQELFSTL